MTDLGFFIKNKREEKGWSQRQLAYKAQVSNTEIKRIEDGERKKPSTQILEKLAKSLGVEYREILFIAGYNLPVKEETVSLPSDAIPVGEMVRIPVYGEIRAGEPAFVQDEIIDWAYIAADQVKGGEYFYLRVKGDSMEGEKIYEGDYVLVRCQPVLEDGHIGVISIIGESANEYGSEATIKKFYRKGNMVVLQPANSKYDPIIVPANDVHIIGEVIKVERWLNGRHI